MIDFAEVNLLADGTPDRSQLSGEETLAHIHFRANVRAFNLAVRMRSSEAVAFAAECARVQADCKHRLAFRTVYVSPLSARVSWWPGRVVYDYVCCCCGRSLARSPRVGHHGGSSRHK